MALNSFPIIEETRKKHLFFFSLCLASSYVDNLILFNLFRYTNEKYTEEHPKRQKCPKRTFWQQFLGHIVSTYGTLFGMHYPPRANLIWAVVVAQRSAAVRNLSSANFKLNIYCCQLYWKYQNNEIKEAGNGPFKKKHLFTLSGYELGTCPPTIWLFLFQLNEFEFWKSRFCFLKTIVGICSFWRSSDIRISNSLTNLEVQ